MLFRIRKYLDEGGGGGEAGDKTPTGEPASDGTPGKTGEPGEGGETKPTETPDYLQDKTPEEQVEILLGRQTNSDKTAAEATKKYDGLKAKLGKQSETVGAYNAFAEAMKTSPEKLVAKLAADAGLDITIGPGKAPDYKSLIGDDGKVTESMLELVGKQAEDRAFNRMKKELGGAQARIMEEHLAQKYPDFDSMAEDRQILQLKTSTGEMQTNELLHLAAQGANMAAAITAAEAKGADDYAKKLAAKRAGVPAEPGSLTIDGKTVKHDPSDPKYLQQVIAGMKKELV